MLALRDVTKTFGARVAVDHVSLTVARGTTRILLGSSGSGKSTILRLILGLLRPDHGEISVDGGMGYVVQEGALYPHLTARQNATLPARAQEWSTARMAERLDVLAKRVALDADLLDLYPAELSGGQRQPVGIALAMFGRAAAPAATPVRVGSKSFTESYVVAEIVARVIEEVSEASVERRFGLGGTGIAFGALASGEIDVYPEYTGTISRAILKDASVTTIDALRSRLRPLGLTISDPLGFANTYALAVARATATRLRLRTISDLARHPGLTAAFDPGFIDRDDG